MQARKLRALLNNTGYILSNKTDIIAIGSPYVTDLISVNKVTMEVRYALDTSKQGRNSFVETARSSGNPELLAIWDKLHELIATGEMAEIIHGKDTIENPLPVFTVVDGVLVESITDKYGYPNTDDNGNLLYSNTHFEEKAKALEYGIREYTAWATNLEEKKQDLIAELEKTEKRLKEVNNSVQSLGQQLLNELATVPKP